jgi:hypothetical protein
MDKIRAIRVIRVLSFSVGRPVYLGAYVSRTAPDWNGGVPQKVII